MKLTEKERGALRALVCITLDNGEHLAEDEVPLRAVLRKLDAGPKRTKSNVLPWDELLTMSGGVDPRARTNVKPHEEFPVQLNDAQRATLTAARAAAYRREAYAACMCRLCALALYPVRTFEEWRALELEQDTSFLHGDEYFPRRRESAYPLCEDHPGYDAARELELRRFAPE